MLCCSSLLPYPDMTSEADCALVTMTLARGWDGAKPSQAWPACAVLSDACLVCCLSYLLSWLPILNISISLSPLDSKVTKLAKRRIPATFPGRYLCRSGVRFHSRGIKKFKLIVNGPLHPKQIATRRDSFPPGQFSRLRKRKGMEEKIPGISSKGKLDTVSA